MVLISEFETLKGSRKTTSLGKIIDDNMKNITDNDKLILNLSSEIKSELIIQNLEETTGKIDSIITNGQDKSDVYVKDLYIDTVQYSNTDNGLEIKESDTDKTLEMKITGNVHINGTLSLNGSELLTTDLLTVSTSSNLRQILEDLLNGLD